MIIYLFDEDMYLIIDFDTFIQIPCNSLRRTKGQKIMKSNYKINAFNCNVLGNKQRFL